MFKKKPRPPLMSAVEGLDELTLQTATKLMEVYPHFIEERHEREKRALADLEAALAGDDAEAVNEAALDVVHLEETSWRVFRGLMSDIAETLLADPAKMKVAKRAAKAAGVELPGAGKRPPTELPPIPGDDDKIH